MDGNIDTVMTEGNKGLLLHFVRALLGQVNSGHLDPASTKLLIEDVEHALNQEKNDLLSVVKAIQSVLESLHCGSAQQCLEYSHAWNCMKELGFPAWDINKLLIAVLDKWGKPQDVAPMA